MNTVNVNQSIVMTRKLQCYSATSCNFTCQSVEMLPYVFPLQVWLKGLSQGLGNGIQAAEKVEQCDYEVISCLATG